MGQLTKFKFRNHPSQSIYEINGGFSDELSKATNNRASKNIQQILKSIKCNPDSEIKS